MARPKAEFTRDGRITVRTYKQFVARLEAMAILTGRATAKKSNIASMLEYCAAVGLEALERRELTDYGFGSAQDTILNREDLTPAVRAKVLALYKSSGWLDWLDEKTPESTSVESEEKPAVTPAEPPVDTSARTHSQAPSRLTQSKRSIV